MDYYVKDINLANTGKKAVEAALFDMPGIKEFYKIYSDKKPLEGIKITGCVIVTYETAAFIVLLKKLGASIRWSSDNKYASLDDACAYIASEGIPIFATSDLSEDKYFWCMEQSAKFPTDNGFSWPDIIIDDGCDITRFLHEKFPEVYDKLMVTCEQTTCGINHHYNLKKLGALKTPVININESVTKSKFDNTYGSSESLIEGIQSSINIQIGGKKSVVYGYGDVGKGCAKILHGLGSIVYIIEIDPIIAMQAKMDGFEVLSRKEVAEIGEIFITATGCIKTIDEQDICLMHNGSILMNMGHSNMEIDTDFLLRKNNFKVDEINDKCKKINIKDNKFIFLLTDGYLINLVGGHGHPPRVMSMTYTNHLLAILEVIKHPELFIKGEIYKMPRILDEKAARLNFPDINDKLTILSDEQERYLGYKKEGPFKREDYRY